MKFKNLFKYPKFSSDILSLFSNQLFYGFAAGMVGLFLPIFLFERFNRSVQNVLLFYIISFILFGLFVPLGARVMSEIGLKKTMILAIPCLAGYYFFLYYFGKVEYLIFLGLALLGITLFRILYWTPYHVNFVEFTNPRARGRQLAFFFSLLLLVGVITPLLAGFTIDRFGFNTLFILATVITVFSILPLFLIRPTREKYSFSYFQTFKELVKKGNRRTFLAFGADGAESVIPLVIWPIFIFQILKENYVSVGIISGAIILVSVLLQLAMGTLSDKTKKRPLIRFGSALYAIGWGIKMLVSSTFQIFIVSTYHSFSGIIRGTPFVTLMYEQMDDSGRYLDEYTVLREVALNVGRIVMLILCFLLLSFVGLIWTFIFAAIASLFINVL